MFVPVKQNLTAYRGATFATLLTLYTDVGQTIPFDLTDYDLTLKIGSLLVLTEGSGLTTGGPAGTIMIRLSPAQTAIYINEHYTLSIANDIDVHYLLDGTFKFLTP